jgi:hypothetical protein
VHGSLNNGEIYQMNALARTMIHGALLMGSLGSALGQNIQTDFDHQADFSQFKTYSWQVIRVADPLWDTRIKNAVNGQLAGKGWTQVDNSAVNTSLAAKDSTPTDSRPQFPLPPPPSSANGESQAGNGADFPFPPPPPPAASLPRPTLTCASSAPCVAIVAIQTTRNQTSLQAFYDGFGGWRGSGGTGEATITPQNYKEGTVVIDMYDVKTKRLIWRGSAEGTLSDKAEKNQKKLENAVAKMFKDFPPYPAKH